MSIDLQPPLQTLAEWIRAHAANHEARLALLARARRVRAGEEEISIDTRRELAAELERWRYRLLDRQADRPAQECDALADALDTLANDVAQRASRPSRQVRRALGSEAADADSIVQAMECLRESLPLQRAIRRATELTGRGFNGVSARRVLLYAPLYLSSHCSNHCVYCGFRGPDTIARRHLSVAEAIDQAEILLTRGIRHILLVAGDFPSLTTTAYFAEIARALNGRGIAPAIEIAPQSTDFYAEMAAAGVCGVTLYQETYDEALYALYHPRGSKASFDWRLEGLERAAEAGIRRLGLGILLGLADPAEDLRALMRHGAYLRSRFSDHPLAFSLPRIHRAPDNFKVPYPVDDETFVRLYCALRIAFPDAELVLSTRESAPLRNHLAGICITQMSAGSSTAPGGYDDGTPQRDGKQFPVSDHRTPAEVSTWLREAGLEVWWGFR